MKKSTLDGKSKFFYGIGNLGYSTISQTMTNFVMFFATSVMGISGTLVGIAIAISAFWDGLSDPIVGYVSDRHKNNFFGRRLGFMLYATIAMAIANLLLWSMPQNISMGVKFVWLFIILMIIETANTFFSTPYVALGIDIAPGYNEQSSLQGIKTIFFIIGMILPSVLMMILMPNSSGQGQLNQSGYINISYITSALCLVCGIMCVFGTIKKVNEMPKYKVRGKEKNAFFKIFYNFFLTLKNKNFAPIIFGYSTALISAAFLTSVGMHLFTYGFHFSSIQIPLVMTALFLGAIVSQPFWVWLSKRIDKKAALIRALLLTLLGILLFSVIFFIRVYISTALVFWFMLPCIFICGFGTGALYSLPISMFADVVTMEKVKTGEDKTATYSGYMTFSYNIANSLALFIIGILLDIIKFNPAEPVQALKVQNGLGLIVILGCSISILLSIFIFRKYKLKRVDVLKSQLLQKNK